MANNREASQFNSLLNVNDSNAQVGIANSVGINTTTPQDGHALFVQGTTDIQLSVLDADKLASANNKAQKQIIEGMNHILKEAEMDRLKNIQTYSMPDLPLKKTLIEIIVKFIEE